MYIIKKVKSKQIQLLKQQISTAHSCKKALMHSIVFQQYSTNLSVSSSIRQACKVCRLQLVQNVNVSQNIIYSQQHPKVGNSHKVFNRAAMLCDMAKNTTTSHADNADVD